SSGTSRKPPPKTSPALFTRTSIRPTSRATCSFSPTMRDVSVTSRTYVRTRVPARANAAAVSRRAPSFTSTSRSSAPSFASRSASAFPMPEAPPVTRTRFPANVCTSPRYGICRAWSSAPGRGHELTTAAGAGDSADAARRPPTDARTHAMRTIACHAMRAIAASLAAVTLAVAAPRGTQIGSDKNVRFERLGGFAAPGTPVDMNQVGILEIGPRAAKNILVLNPGTSASAAYFAPLAKTIVSRAKGWQVWSVERRENLLEDHSFLDKGKAQ